MKRVMSAAIALSVVLLPVHARSEAVTPEIDYAVVGTFPHDTEAFTEGLDFWGGRLFESTGLNGESTIREVDLETGAVLRSRTLPERFFGEGMTIRRGRAFWVTWKSETGFTYDADELVRTGRFAYRGEGWGLTHNGRRLVMSNGTDVLTFRQPRTFRVVRRVRVRDGTSAVGGLNELEWVNGSIFANVWPSDLVVRIDPATGDVTGRLDLSDLHAAEEATRDVAETNGIAYLGADDRFFVTGKYWSKVYELDLQG